MNLLLQQTIIGLSIGSVYALLAVGYALITSIFNFTNFGYGSVMMCGAFAAFLAVEKLGLSTFAGLIFAIVFFGYRFFDYRTRCLSSVKKKRGASPPTDDLGDGL